MVASRVKKRKKKQKLTALGKLIIGVSVTLIVLSVLTVAGLIAINMNLFQDETGGITDDIGTPDVIKDKVQTFLIVGISDDEAERSSTALTDTIMVTTVDFETKQASILQIPRDTYIGNETPTGKINSIYNRSPENWDYSGINGLSRMIHEMFQLNIDHYVTVKMDGFADIVDSIGGVTMNVPTDMELNGTFVPAGERTLTGKEAIAVVRTRNVYNNQDIGRMQTQRLFLSAFINKCLSLGVGDMTKLIPKCFESVSTDLTVKDALNYYKAMKDVDTNNINAVIVPGEAIKHETQWVYSVYPERTAQLLNDYFRPHSDPVPAEQLQIKTLVEEPPITQEEDMGVGTLGETNTQE